MDLVELATGVDVDLAFLGALVGVLSGLAGIHHTAGQKLVDRLLHALNRIGAVAFIGTETRKGVRASKHVQNGNVTFEPDPEKRIVLHETGYVAGIFPDRPRVELRAQSWPGNGEEYFIVTIERVEASARIYAPIACLSIAWLTVALIVNPKWLLMPLMPWVYMLSEWMGTEAEFPSIIVNPLAGLGYLLLAFISTVISFTFILVAPIRAMGGFAGWTWRRWSPAGYRVLMSTLLLVAFILGTTGA